MLKILSELKEADRFWPWLYKIAKNKLRLHKRKEFIRRTTAPVPVLAMINGMVNKSCRDEINDMVVEEFMEIVVRAMGRLKSEHRAVITMRCYRGMAYSAIGESLGCSQFAAKMLFYRAKKSLKKQLARQGFGKGSLLMALLVFGKITSPSEAAGIMVSASSIKVGTTGVVGFLTSKAALLPIAAVGVITLVTVLISFGSEWLSEIKW